MKSAPETSSTSSQVTVSDGDDQTVYRGNDLEQALAVLGLPVACASCGSDIKLAKGDAQHIEVHRLRCLECGPWRCDGCGSSPEELNHRPDIPVQGSQRPAWLCNACHEGGL